jgi:tetratricopeptide (TPR) repeat protein
MSRKCALRLNVPFDRVSLPLALLFCLVQIKPAWAAQAQDKEWDGHMKAANQASMSSNYKKAEKEFQAALARTHAFPPSDLRTAETLTKLATLYTKEEKFTEAETRQKQAVAILEASAPSDDPRLACAMIGLAVVMSLKVNARKLPRFGIGFFPSCRR